MLRITQQDSAKGAKRYYASADYYSEEIVGLWGGEGARLLGLEGVVDKESFERLCDNLDPASGRKLTVRTRADRTVGYDFTFSVPKSVSLLYAMTGDQEILDAFRSAVDETMRDIEVGDENPRAQGRQGCRPRHRQHGLGGVHPHDLAAGGRRSRSAAACPLLRLQFDLGRGGAAAGRPGSSAT